jgi:hypothetical protein
MVWFDFSDPLFLTVLAVLLLLVALAFDPMKRLREAVEKAQLMLQRETANRDRALLPSSRNVAGDQNQTYYDAQKKLQTDEALRLMRGETDNHLRELEGEDQLALRAAKERDAYDRKREKARGGVQASGTRNPVSQPAGSEQVGQKPASGTAGPDKKAADRHRKPKPPDADSRV